MALREEMEKSGMWLFRWRSYLPLAVLALSLIAFHEFKYPFDSEWIDRVWEIFCLAVSVSGVILRMVTIGHVPRKTSGRNTKGQVADELNTTGMYSVVRNPLYLGNFIIWFGLSLFVRVWWLSLIVTLIFWLYYERIIFAEEEYLRNKFGRQYLDWAEKTPVFIPRFSQWRSSSYSFSLRTALKEEYSGFFAIIVIFTLMEIGGDYIILGKLQYEIMWRIISISGLFIYTTLRFMKKTKRLNVEGRP
jgi:protein-S-isoprenylcysteine O-methyltransferase Ste14